MKILLIGATGLLGTSLKIFFDNQKKNSVISYSRHTSPALDICSVTSTKEVIGNLQPDMIINLAALTNVDQCEESPADAFLFNSQACKNIRVAAGASCPIIHISTDHFYDSPGLSDEISLNPVNYYAYSKLLGEFMLGENSLILRTNFFGKSKTTKKSFSDWIYEQLSSGNKIELFEDSFFSPLSIDALSQIIIHCVENFIPGTYNLGSNAGISKHEFGMTFAKALELDTNLISAVKMKDKKLKAARPHDMRMDVSHFEETFKMKLPDLNQLIQQEKNNYN